MSRIAGHTSKGSIRKGKRRWLRRWRLGRRRRSHGWNRGRCERLKDVNIVVGTKSFTMFVCW